MKKQQKRFLKSLFQDEIDRETYEVDFAPLAQDTHFIDECVATVNQKSEQSKPRGEALSRIAFALFLAEQYKRAIELWEEDIASESIGWWQYCRYMECLVITGDIEKAERTTADILTKFPQAKNVNAAFGFAILAIAPEKANAYLEKDYVSANMTPGFKLNYACAAASWKEWEKAERLVNEAYRESQNVTDGFCRIAWIRRSMDDNAAAIERLFQNDRRAGRITSQWELNHAIAIAHDEKFAAAENMIKELYWRDSALKDGFSRLAWERFTRQYDAQEVERLFLEDLRTGRITSRWELNHAIAIAHDKKFATAENIVKKLYQQNAKLKDGFSRLAWERLTRQYDAKEVERLFQIDLKSGRITPESELNYAIAKAMANDLDEAIEITRRLYNAYPQLKNGFSRIAVECLMPKNRWRDARETFALDINLDRLDTPYLIHYIRCLVFLNKIREAETLAEQLYQKSPTTQDAYSTIAIATLDKGCVLNCEPSVYVYLKASEIAITYFKKDYAIGRISPDALWRYAETARHLGNLLADDKLVQQSETLINEISGEARERDNLDKINLAVKLAEKGDLDTALKLASESYAADSELKNAYSQVGWAYYAARLAPDDAAKIMRRDVELGRSTPLWRTLLAISPAIIGDFTNAIKRVERLYADDPFSMDAHSLIAIINWHKERDLDKAIDYVKRDISTRRATSVAQKRLAVFLGHKSIAKAKDHLIKLTHDGVLDPLREISSLNNNDTWEYLRMLGLEVFFHIPEKLDFIFQQKTLFPDDFDLAKAVEQELVPLRFSRDTLALSSVTIRQASLAFSIVRSHMRGEFHASLRDAIALYAITNRLARATPPPQRKENIRILEIGSLFGGSALVMATATRNAGVDASLYCVDSFEGYYNSPRTWDSGVEISPKAINDNWLNFGFNLDNLRLFKGLSSTAPIISQIERQRYDIAFIDGDHSYLGIINDWRNFSRLIRDNGFIMFHDYQRFAFPGATSAINEIRQQAATDNWQDLGYLGTVYCLKKQPSSSRAKRHENSE